MSEHDRGEDAPSEDTHKKNSPGENAAGEVGFARGLTNYGDRGFSLYLRRSFARSMGYSTEMLSAYRGHRQYQRIQQPPSFRDA